MKVVLIELTVITMYLRDSLKRYHVGSLISRMIFLYLIDVFPVI